MASYRGRGLIQVTGHDTRHQCEIVNADNNAACVSPRQRFDPMKKKAFERTVSTLEQALDDVMVN